MTIMGRFNRSWSTMSDCGTISNRDMSVWPK